MKALVEFWKMRRGMTAGKDDGNAVVLAWDPVIGTSSDCPLLLRLNVHRLSKLLQTGWILDVKVNCVVWKVVLSPWKHRVSRCLITWWHTSQYKISVLIRPIMVPVTLCKLSFYFSSDAKTMSSLILMAADMRPEPFLLLLAGNIPMLISAPDIWSQPIRKSNERSCNDPGSTMPSALSVLVGGSYW